ncbi:MAG: Cdc6/Cdc18 family protein, partial [Halobaculum sp.]
MATDSQSDGPTRTVETGRPIRTATVPVREGRMIEDARVLREGFVPNDAIHRDAEVNALSRTLDPITRGEPAEPALITGPSGVGKTTVARFVVEQLQQATLDLAAVHVNCWQAHSRFKTVYEILDQLGRTVDVHRRSTPYDELLDRLAAVEGPPVVVTLDEVDQLEDTRVVYDLYQLSGYSTTLITNDETAFLSSLDGRVHSRLAAAETVAFDPYTVSELVDILAARVDHGLVPGAITDTQLRRIADAAAGDARVALSILRSGARRAEYDGRDRITDADVAAAVPEGRRAVRTKNLEALRPAQRELFELLVECGEIAPGALYDRYVDR